MSNNAETLGEALERLRAEIAALPQPLRWWYQRRDRRLVARIARRRDAVLRREGWIR
jgi:hypothetical protein